MPELPEVETVRRGLQPVMEGSRIERAEVRRPDLRFPFPTGFARRIEGARIRSLGRRAKYLTAELDRGETLVMHLGMSGSFRIAMEQEGSTPGIFHHDRSKSAAHDHVVFHLDGSTGRASVTYNDPRRFGFMDLFDTARPESFKPFAGLGIEPLGNELSGELLADLFAGKGSPVKASLLDQRLIAGLGNIYACEALHMAGISPLRRTASLVRANGRPGPRLAPLAEAIREVLARAIEAGGSSLRDHRQADGSLGYFQHSFRVYDREGEPCPAPGCPGTIRRTVQSGRSSFHCPHCQR